MGKGGGGVKVKTSPLEQASANIANRQDARAQLMEKEFIDPIRGLVTPQILGALGTNPFETSLSAAGRHGLESQFNQAKSNLMNTAAPGGLLRSQMAGLERDRALGIAGAQDAARQQGIGRALQFAGGALPSQAGTAAQTQSAMQGLQGANASASQRAIQNAQLQQQSDAGKGQLAGTLGKAALSAVSAFSSRDFKEDIVPYIGDPLTAISATPIYTWRYIGDSFTHLGPVTEEAPQAILTPSGKEIDIINYLGLLLASVKELTAKVAALEAK